MHKFLMKFFKFRIPFMDCFLYIFVLLIIGILMEIFLSSRSIFAGAFILLAIFVGMVIFSYDTLPGRCLYNPLGVYEIHIHDGCAGNKKEFIRICHEMIQIGIRKHKNIMFSTWHIREDHLKKIFQDAITITRPTLLERFVGHIDMWRYQRKYKDIVQLPYIRCLIDVSKLQEIQFMKNRITVKT